ncbi:MAG: ATP-dependent Clp protease ATP-binding subunit [Candidatus Eremiobacteraeota bacterium]|nr:ATP-dependent Clp protease ATP-binding subunit [Candidatus Eremiobacteraeota bacterium]MCW5871678.1 ATP-dependent Clp protease ATP-binding subunit [Candidatus Eremiobacteraeota bacterium]
MKKLANELSVRWKHHYLSTEHYLYACCQLDGDCGRWLGRRGFTLQSLEEEILRWVPEGDEVPIWEGMIEAPRLRRIITKMCVEEAEAQKSMRVEPKHILAAILSEGGGIAARLLRNRGNELRAVRGELLGGTSVPPVEAPRGESRHSAESGKEGPKAAGGGKEKYLNKYARDLVDLARQGKIDPVIGRNDEVRRVIQTLTKKGKSNPVLIGEAGVGKTAVAYGLALRIAQGQVPDVLKDRRVLDLSLSSMVAGAKHRGEFEERLEGVVQEATADPTIILFIDEIHQLVGAGDSRGGMDASNILKPALARGDFPVLGATTTDEYRKYIEADPALERRFQMVLVGEPSEADALEILRGLRPRYESHHGVKFTDQALLQAVKLSVRFIPDRNLPDKAIDLIDEAAARIKTRSGVFMAGERPVFEVNEEVIAEVVSDHSGIPVQRMTQEETTRLLEMEHYLADRVVGQDHAVKAVAETIRVVRVGLVSPNRPGGVFLFLGPSGVGKTELAKALAEFLFGSDRDLVRLDMSEFHDKHSLSRLIGSPPGYVGHEEEGQLTGAVRTKPYCVVLLDEVEKAHPEIFDIFLQVFDDGRLTDSKGRTCNFANTIIVLTSNLGAREVIASGQSISEGMAGQLDQLPPLYQKALREHFRPEFLNRIDEIVSFRSLAPKDLEGIVRIHLKRLVETLKDKEVALELRQDAIDFLLEVGYQPQFGARPLQRAINTYVSRPLAEEMLRNRTAAGSIVTVYRSGDRLAFAVTAGRPPQAPPPPQASPPPRPTPPPQSPPPRPEALPLNPVPEPPRGGGLANLPLPKRPMRQTGDHTGLSQEPPAPVAPTRPLADSPTLSGERTYLPLGDSGTFKKPPSPPAPPPDSAGDQWSNFRRPEER